MTIQELLTEGKMLLGSPSPSSFIDTPALDAALLLSEILHKSREELIAGGKEPVSEAERKAFYRFLERRKNGECVAYILGRREFRGLEFTVNHNVLVPRPDTETLVETVLEYIDSRKDKNNLFLLDLCTGSGALAISLKNERPFLTVTASDISPKALETAALNAARLLDSGSANVQFIQSDLFENIAGRFDIIVSNPPYVPSGDLASLAPEVQREPHLALDGGEDGLKIIRRIISRAGEYLLPGGLLLLEASPEQMPVIRTFLETHSFDNIRIHKDLAGRDRVIEGRMTERGRTKKG